VPFWSTRLVVDSLLDRMQIRVFGVLAATWLRCCRTAPACFPRGDFDEGSRVLGSVCPLLPPEQAGLFEEPG
jgi:hypothetical protein